MKRIIIIILIALPMRIYAQSDAQYSQFSNAKLFYNPAAIDGREALLNIGLLDREQWMGYAGRPSFRMLNASYFFQQTNMGAGLTISDYTQNVEHVLNVKASYAYQLQINHESYVSMGLSAGFISRFLRNIETVSSIENIVKDEYNNIDLGLGFEYVSSNIVAGISMTHIPVFVGMPTYRVSPHFYGYFSYNFFLADKWILTPSLILRNSILATNLDVNLQLQYRKRFSVGVAYRLDAFVFMAGVHLGKNFLIAYSFDLNTGSVRNTSNKGQIRPSHEFGLSYKGFLTDVW